MYKLLLCWRSLTLLAILLASGCGSVVTEQPLSDAGKDFVDESLVGVWQELDDTVFAHEFGETTGVELTVTLRDDGLYRVVGCDENEKEEGIFEGRCFDLEGRTFFSPTRLLQRIDKKLLDVSEKNLPGTLFINLDLQEDILEVRVPDPEAFAKLLERSDALNGSAKGWLAKEVVISSPPAEAAQEIVKHFDILFGKPNRYRRKIDQQSGASPEANRS